MALVLTSPPGLEPVTLAEAKAHLRVDGGDEDGLIQGLIVAARKHVERNLVRALITQGWSLFLDAWPVGLVVALPLTPLQSVSAVTTYDSDGAGSVLDAEHYFVDAVSTPPRLVLTRAQPWPRPGRRANGIEIAFLAGHGDAPGDVPEPIRQALLLLIAHWFERREPVALDGAPELVPVTVAGLLQPYRVVRL